jgi:hypothetical protein
MLRPVPVQSKAAANLPVGEALWIPYFFSGFPVPVIEYRKSFKDRRITSCPVWSAILLYKRAMGPEFLYVKPHFPFETGFPLIYTTNNRSGKICLKYSC